LIPISSGAAGPFDRTASLPPSSSGMAPLFPIGLRFQPDPLGYLPMMFYPGNARGLFSFPPPPMPLMPPMAAPLPAPPTYYYFSSQQNRCLAAVLPH
jgi:hypothetical protein